MNGDAPPRQVKPRWAPRVPQHQIRRLYESIANGRVDDELLDDVGFTLYLRCKSILTVGEIYAERRLPCPQCGRSIPLDPATRIEDVTWTVVCTDCGWALQWRDYWATFRHQELGAGGARDIFDEFLRRWEAARSSAEKVIAVDQIIHQWHWETASERPSFGLGRPTGVNLIEGNRQDVINFLDGLTYGVNSPPDVAASRDAWREGLREVRERQAHFRERPGRSS